MSWWLIVIGVVVLIGFGILVWCRIYAEHGGSVPNTPSWTIALGGRFGWGPALAKLRAIRQRMQHEYEQERIIADYKATQTPPWLRDLETESDEDAKQSK